MSAILELIETLWNVNLDDLIAQAEGILELIETYWNAK